MTRISVNDVSMLPTSYPTGNTAKSTGSDFQSILSEQTENSKIQEDAARQDVTVDSSSKPEPDVDTDQPEVKNDTEAQAPTEAVEPKENVIQEADVNNDGSDAEEEMQQENLMAVMEEILASLKQQIMDTLNISEEEFAGMLEDMNLSELELLQPAKLSEFVLEATGAQDSLALLTNEGLLQDYRQITQRLGELLEQGSQELNVSVEELNQMVVSQTSELAENPETIDAVAEMPVQERNRSITVEVEATSTEQKAEQNPMAMAATTGEKASGSAAEGNVHSETKGESQSQQSTQQTTAFAFQNVQASLTQVTNQTVQGSNPIWNQDTQNIMNQIMDYMKLQVKPDMSNLEMQLHPASLGTIQIQLEATGDAVNAHFITQNEAVKAVLEVQMIELKQQFQEQGVKVEAIEVSVQTQTFEQSFEQGRQAEQMHEEVRPRIRRINLSEMTDMDIPGEMEEADRITMEMMNANGNTVDYMA